MRCSPEAMEFAVEAIQKLAPLDLQQCAAGNPGVLYFLTDTTRSGAKGYIRAFVVTRADPPRLQEVTAPIAAVLSLKTVEHQHRWWISLNYGGNSMEGQIVERLSEWMLRQQANVTPELKAAAARYAYYYTQTL